ncbi:MAG: Gfo/Idh/MocA family oxidoreductase [Dysgonamonadaceae bacterium]
MSDDINNRKDTAPDNEKNRPVKKHSESRRDALKTLATLPVLGAMGYGVYKKKKNEENHRIASQLFHFDEKQTILPVQPEGEQIRLGIIGFGIRGSQLLQAIGFATPTYVEDLKETSRKNPSNTRYQDFLDQDSVNVVINGVCDIFETYAKNASAAGANINREGLNGKYGKAPKIYKHYKELLAAPDIDAVIIATPDHWHGTMIMDAAKAGKHIYAEKPLTWTVPETYLVKEAIENSNIVFQLGHQGRQIEIYKRARDIIEKGQIGKVSLIETSTNRNDPNGAWVYPIHEDANPSTIDWAQCEGPEERVKEYMDYMNDHGLEKYIGPESRDKFSLERFFRWRCWWDYSTGLSGDLLTHEYDAMNQIFDLGIPTSATSSGGVYFFKDGRTVPDVLQTTFEFADKDLTMLYTATQANQYNRSRKIMGHDATMELGSALTITIDGASTQYKDKIDSGIIKPGEPFYRYIPGRSVDALTSATEMYFAERGLLFSYVKGKRYNTTFLHIREWLECIRQGVQPSCGIKESFEEAITAHMGTRAYLEGKTKYWDKEKKEIV